jgi:hypothetical protein
LCAGSNQQMPTINIGIRIADERILRWQYLRWQPGTTCARGRRSNANRYSITTGLLRRRTACAPKTCVKFAGAALLCRRRIKCVAKSCRCQPASGNAQRRRR